LEKREEDGAPTNQRAIEGRLISQRELVVNHAGDFYRLPGKLSRGESGLECSLNCRIAQHRWTTGRIRRNHLAGLVEDHIH